MLMAGSTTSTSRCRRCCRWYVLLVLAVILSCSVADDDRRRRPTTRDICQRDPPDIRVDSMPGDHGFLIQILGRAVRYTPGQVYTGQWARRIVNLLFYASQPVPHGTHYVFALSVAASLVFCPLSRFPSGAKYTVFIKKHPLLFACITLRKSYKFQ